MNAPISDGPRRNRPQRYAGRSENVVHAALFESSHDPASGSPRPPCATRPQPSTPRAGPVMAGSITCDWCGHSIDNFSALNKMLCYGLPAIREWHLHLPRDGYECMERAVEAFDKHLRYRAAGRGDAADRP